jgi:hypothetical protein
MAYTFVKNISKKEVTIWYGHTPYHIPPGHTKEVPVDAYKLNVKHNDYKGKIKEVQPGGEDLLTSETPVEEPKVNPWDDDDWSPSDANRDVLNNYANAHGLTISADISDEDAQEIVIEHHMTN